jgi:hypothetical protein
MDPFLQGKKKPKRGCPRDKDKRVHQQRLIGFILPTGKRQVRDPPLLL